MFRKTGIQIILQQRENRGLAGNPAGRIAVISGQPQSKLRQLSSLGLAGLSPALPAIHNDPGHDAIGGEQGPA